MEKTKLRTKAMNILQEHLAEEEFARIQSVMIGDSEALKIAKLEHDRAEKELQTASLQATVEKNKLNELTAEDIKNNADRILAELAEYLDVEQVVHNPFTVSVAMAYDQKGTITQKQKAGVLNYNCIPKKK